MGFATVQKSSRLFLIENAAVILPIRTSGLCHPENGANLTIVISGIDQSLEYSSQHPDYTTSHLSAKFIYNYIHTGIQTPGVKQRSAVASYLCSPSYLIFGGFPVVFILFPKSFCLQFYLSCTSGLSRSSEPFWQHHNPHFMLLLNRALEKICSFHTCPGLRPIRQTLG